MGSCIRSVFILDPRLNFHIVFECNGLIAMAWFYSRRSVIVQYIEDHIASGGVQCEGSLKTPR